MLNAGKITLLEAVSLSIERIKEGYNRDWLVFSCGNAAEGYDVCNSACIDISREYVRLFEPEHHGFTEFCICMDGCFALQLGCSIVELSEGNICPILPGIMHCELPRQEDEYTAVWISVDFNRVVLHLASRGKQTPFSIFEVYIFRPNYECIRFIDCIRSEMEQKKLYFSDIVKAELLKLLVAVNREMECANSGIHNSNTWKESIAREVVNYIKDNYSKYIRLADISQMVCISPNYLNSIFKSVTGKTIMQYHEDYRIDIAKSLLADPEYSINEISQRLGFYDQYHFSQIFKKGTPMEFFDINCMIGEWGFGNLHFKSAGELSEEMGRLGIGRALVFDSRSWLYDPKYGNDILVEETRGYDRLIPVMAVTSLVEHEFGGEDHVYNYIMENQIGAVRLFPNDHGYTLHSWNTGRLFSLLNEIHMPVFLECRPVDGAIDCLYGQICEIASQYRDTPIVLLSAGYRSLRILYELFDKCPNIYIDTSTFITYRGIEDVVKHFGAGRILFGTRMPFMEGGVSVGRLIYADIALEEKEHIASVNIQRLLNDMKLFRRNVRLI